MLKKYFSYLGPGLLMAGAAIGVSHLVQSTRAGADYGWQLLWIILLANLIKYPFFEFGSRYTAATGKTLLDGYHKLGKGYLLTYILANIVTSIGSIAAITFVTSALLANLMPFELHVSYWAVILVTICTLMFAKGHYHFIDRFIKVLMVVLVVTTISAFSVAIYKGGVATPDFVSNTPWELASVAFLIALMGWMPAPIEISTWQSLWMEAKTRDEGKAPTLKQALRDFNFGYILCAVLAIMFLGLGALVMHGSGAEFSSSGVGFAKQVVDLYTNNIGEFARPIIAIAAFTTMFSTTITLLDAYPRSLGYATNIMLGNGDKPYNKMRWVWTAILYLAALIIIFAFTSNIKTLVDIVTIVAFLAGPFFAYLNIRAVYSKHMPADAKPKLWLTILTIIGFITLVVFAVGFLVSRFIL